MQARGGEAAFNFVTRVAHTFDGIFITFEVL